jgi:RNA polymerase-binding transcription factor
MQPIETIRNDLLRRRRALLRHVDRLEGDLQHLERQVEPELEEEVQEESLGRLLAGLDERGKAELEAIDVALARMEAGDYGRCEDCGDLIPVERLRALPTTTTCVFCSEARERRRA